MWKTMKITRRKYTKRNSQKAFTLIELMIVVVLIGILAAIAVPSFMEYMKRAKATEAVLQLNAVGKAAKQTWGANSAYPVAAGTGMPVMNPGGVGKGCCGGPNKHCAPSAGAWTGGWAELGFEIREPTLFYYAYTGDGAAGAEFTATATGDLDCDGNEVTYTLTGTSPGGNPAVALTAPPSNAD
jgi:prepilin-type N-terminal cleavage/methylation domain-containing protein